MVSPLCHDSITKRRPRVIYLLPDCLRNLQELSPCPPCFFILFFTSCSPVSPEICLCTFLSDVVWMSRTITPVWEAGNDMRMAWGLNMNFYVFLECTSPLCTKCLAGCHIYLIFFFYLWCANMFTNSNQARRRWSPVHDLLMTVK